MKPAARKDLLFGGSAGALVCATFVLSVATMGPLLGIEWPGFGRGSAPSEAISIPAAQVGTDRSAPRAANGRSAASDRATASAADRRRRSAPSSDPARRRAPRRVDVPATTLPRDTAPAPAAPAVPSAPAASAAPAPATQTAAPATTARTRGMTLRVASVAVSRPVSDGAPELRVGLAIADPKPGVVVPEQVNLRLRPELPAEPQPAGTALALRAAIDVVDAGPGDSEPLQMRVRMALAAADTDAPTVADRGDGDGQSNVLDLNVPLSALAPASEDPGGGAEPDSPAQPPAGGAPPAVEPSLETEVRLDLVAAPTSGDEAAETTEVPVPADATGDEPAQDSVPVTVVVDGATPVAQEPVPAPAAPPAEPQPEPAPADPAPAAVSPDKDDDEHEHDGEHEGDAAPAPVFSR